MSEERTAYVNDVGELSAEELEAEQVRLSIELGQQLAEIWRLEGLLRTLANDVGYYRSLRGRTSTYLQDADEKMRKSACAALAALEKGKVAR